MVRMPTQKNTRAAARTPAADPLAQPLSLLGGLTPEAFMHRHWHKRPLLVRQALPGLKPPVSRADVFRLVAQEDVESRLIQRDGKGPRARWTLQPGPLPRRALPPLQQPGWTVLVQGLNLHVPAADELLSRFRFIPQARLDDLMVSWASEGGGVGPHFDSYDVFLIQVQGQRRWRIGRMDDAKLRANVPVKLIANFRYEQEWVLEPGDMLYLPPGWAHDGDAVGGECMTCSVGFRSATQGELVRESLLRLADAVGDALQDETAQASAGPAGVREGLRALYTDPKQAPTQQPGRVPATLQQFAQRSVMAALRAEGALDRALGEYLSEPKPQVYFHAADPAVFEHSVQEALAHGVRLDARSCMLYDEAHVYLNGESWHVAGRDAQMLQRLADGRALPANALRGASAGLRRQLLQWLEDGWLQAGAPDQSGA
jgi:50S ribosomal protein L16 3-hydroxylase